MNEPPSEAPGEMVFSSASWEDLGESRELKEITQVAAGKEVEDCKFPSDQNQFEQETKRESPFAEQVSARAGNETDRNPFLPSPEKENVQHESDNYRTSLSTKEA